MRYVVGYINFDDNELILEEVLANNPHEAFWRHSKLQDNYWNDCKSKTEGMNTDQLQDWSFDFDMLVSVLKLS